MKFTCYTEINLPVKHVSALFNDPNNLERWQVGFISRQHIRGIPGDPGAKSRITILHGKKRIVLTETIIYKNLPFELDALYEHENMVNTLANRFISLEENKTRYEAQVEYMKFIGFVPNIIARLMPGIFKRQTQKWINSFKAFAESEGRSSKRR